ncbi:MAG: hypothetical protein U0790_24705 [Isosphaeraceae bacterium]
MDPAVADDLPLNPVYREPNRVLRVVCDGLGLPLVDATEALTRAEAAGVPQFWEYDSHPRPAGYATIARSIHDSWMKTTHRRETQ